MIFKKTRFVNGQFEHFPDIPISGECPILLADRVSASVVGDICTLSAGRQINVNNRPFVGEMGLSANTVIEVDRDIFVFYQNPSPANKPTENSVGPGEERIQRVAEIEKKYSATSLRALKKKHFDIFWADGKAKKDLQTISSRLIEYARKKLSWERAIVLRIIGKQGIAIAAKGLPATFRVPNHLIFPAWRTKKAVFFKMRDAEDEEKIISLSIREQRIQHSMIIPFSSSDRLVAMLYVDSTSQKINDSSYFLLSHICAEIASTIAVMLDFPDLKEINL